MDKNNVYQLLEEKMLNYTDYEHVPVESTDEPLLPIPNSHNLTARQLDATMLAYTGVKVYVRQSVLAKLKEAANLLSIQDSTLRLEVVYGYRALAIQQALFDKYKEQLRAKYTGKQLLAATHRLVAIPEVAGHPAGATVDIQIIQGDGQSINFGTKMHEFVPDTFTFSPFISRQAWDNRQLLRGVMLRAGFAPFDGEWWHFSYGDKEWARYYNQPAAVYDQVNFKLERK